MFPPDAIPVRTPAGEACLADNDARLAGRQRQLLRLVDGARRVAQIAVMMPGRDLAAALVELHAQGLVAAQGAAIRVASTGIETTALPARWREALEFMKTHAVDAMGLMAQPVVQRLEQVRDSAAARGAVARWHMALRESRHGRAQADARLQVVTEILDLQ